MCWARGPTFLPRTMSMTIGTSSRICQDSITPGPVPSTASRRPEGQADEAQADSGEAEDGGRFRHRDELEDEVVAGHDLERDAGEGREVRGREDVVGAEREGSSDRE